MRQIPTPGLLAKGPASRTNLQRDTPEHLLDRTRKGLDGVLRLGRRETHQLGSGEGEGGGGKDGAETDEAVLQRAGFVPVTSTPILVVSTMVRTSAQHEDERNDHEDDDGAKLEDGRDKLLLCVAEGAEDVEYGNGRQEDQDPDDFADLVIPVRYRD